jgi:hypothetical protein
MLIKVTEQDIIGGQKTFDKCPLTVALRKYFGNKISVSRDYIRIAKKKQYVCVPLPKAAQNFMLNYDNNAYHGYPNVEAFKFNLSPKVVTLIKNATMVKGTKNAV